ncbi:hypothetical protein [Jeotgalibacillus marinus]|uniref:Uncharacterized protein n=1 Tax=Jeotgalibacillus marinus TaxID=86667 RepID=A0ABV3Q0J8_9BACL
MAKTLVLYATIILMIVITIMLYNRMLGAIPLLLLSIVLYYCAFLESKQADKDRKQ